jgi:hypothetical protein
MVRQFPNRQEFSASGTFNVPAGISLVWVSLWGAGGASSGSGVRGGCGGSGCIRMPFAVTPSGTVTVTVGEAGAGAGPDSSFGALVAPGGAAGGGGTTAEYPAATESPAPYMEGVVVRGGAGLPSSSASAQGQGGSGAFGAEWGRGGGSNGAASDGYCIVEW